MTISLIKRLENHARLRPTEWISGQTYEDLARSLGYKASNVGRRLRELETAGVIENRYVRGHVEYKWRGEEKKNPQKEALDRIYNQSIHNRKMTSHPIYQVKESTPSPVGETARLFG